MTDARTAMCGKRALGAEDEDLIAQGLARHLRAAGAEVVGPAPTISEALDLSRVERVDGAVLDINLRDDLVLANAPMARGVPFVFATGYGASVIPERFAAPQERRPGGRHRTGPDPTPRPATSR